MIRVFFNDNGKIYAGEKPKHENHAEMNFPTPDIISALTHDLDGKEHTGIEMTREVMIATINNPVFQRTCAVLAEEKVKNEKTDPIV